MNKKVDALLEDFMDNGEFVSVIIEEPISYVAIRLGHLVGVGMMRCMPGDTFDRHFGYSNALRKALKDICEQREKIERSQIEHDKALIKQRLLAEDKEYAERMRYARHILDLVVAMSNE